MSSIEPHPAAPIVYVIEQQPFDYTPAMAFGEVKFMEPRKLAPVAPSDPGTWNSSVLAQMRKELSNYIPGYDYIIPTGAPNRMMLAGMLLAEMGKAHNILGWDTRTQRYLHYRITL